MRNVLNISLPEEMVRTVRDEVRAGQFASTSEFFRHLLRQWRTSRFGHDLQARRNDFKAGKARVLRSLKQLR